MNEQPPWSPGSAGPSDPHEPHEPYRPQPGAYQPQPGGYQPQGRPYDPNVGQFGGPPVTPNVAPVQQIDLGPAFRARTRMRPEPRLSIVLAAAGAGLALLSVGIWSVGFFVAGFHLGFSEDTGAPSVHGDSRRFLGAGLFLVLAVAGYAITVLRRRGPLAAGGTVASAAGVPFALVFLFLDIGGTATGGGFPVNVDAVYLISIVVWLVSYVFVPGARGRAVYLGLAASGLYAYIAFKIAGTGATRAGASALGGTSFGGFGSVHAGGVAALGLSFGLVYYALAALLDRGGRAGASVALVFAGFGATLGGLVAGLQAFGQIGSGFALLLVGGLLAFYGGWSHRRFTTWTWSAVAAVGVVVLITKIDVGDHYAIVGILVAVLGLVVVALAPLLASTLREPPDIDDGEQPLSPAPSSGGTGGR